MLNKIIAFSIKNKLLIGLFVIALVGYGSFEVTKLPIDAVPDITDNQVQVITSAPSLGAPDVERLITFPIEQANSNIPGIKEIRSFSRFGLSLITIVFEDDVDVYWARQQVTERLKIAETQIPEGIGNPELAPVTTGLGEIYQYVVKAKPGYEGKYDLTELRTIQDWIIRRQLLGVQGVADVSSFGGKLKQYEVAIDVNKLHAHQVTIQDVFDALNRNNENTGGAYIEKKSTVLYIRSEGLLGSVEDINHVVVKHTSSGAPLLIKHIAEVQIGHAIRYGSMTYNDEGEVAGAVVMMLKGGNSSEVIKKVKSAIAQIEKTLPEGVEIEPFLDRTKMVDNAISTVSKNLLEGALIVIFVLVIFLGNVRAGFIVASVIPLSMLFAVIMMNQFGVSGNLMSLGALDFGLIVDGAVIIVEAVMHMLHKQTAVARLKQSEMDGRVLQVSGRMMNSAVFGQIIILIVYLPILSLSGIEGKMFKPMAQTVAFALIGAFILSLTYVPMMSSLMLKKVNAQSKNWSDKWMQSVEKFYHKALSRVLQFPKILLSMVVVLGVVAFFILSRLGGEFIPSLEEGDFAVDTRVLTGSNLQTTTEACLQGAKVLKEQFPEVIKVVGKIGSGEIPVDPMPMNAADMMVILKPKKEWTSAKTFNELSDKMSVALSDIPGVTFGFQYPVQMRFNELMTGAKQDVVCKIYGENLDTLVKYAEKLGSIASHTVGAADVYIEPVNGLPQVIVRYNRPLIAQYGLNISDINRALNTAFAGESSGLVFEDEKRFDLVVRMSGDQRQKLEDVQRLLISTPEGNQIPLQQVADVFVGESVNQIQREDAKRRVMVGFNVRGKDVQSVVTDLQQKVDKQLNLPPGYYVDYGGSFENLIAARQRLSIAVPVSLLLIFTLLYFAFNSLKHAILIYTAIPLSAIGGVFFLALRDMPFSISAGVGFIALFGVAVLNGIVLIAEFNRIKNSGMNDLKQIVLTGAQSRLRPVLMTASVASLGFLPMALSNGSGAEVQRPLATVVIGGLLIATMLTLFVLPVLYIIFEKVQMKPKRLKTGLAACIALMFLPALSNAQQPIGLQAAWDTAVKNNLLIKNARLQSEYEQKLKSASVDIPGTTFATEYGQINSVYNDSRLGIAQTISFPTVYTRQKALQNEIYKSSLIQIESGEARLKKDVSELYFQILYLYEKQSILKFTDSIYSVFAGNAKKRFDLGESNALEKSLAESQRAQIAVQLKQLQQDIEILQMKFQWLLNTPVAYIPQTEVLDVNTVAPMDTMQFNQHPDIRLLRQAVLVSAQQTRLMRSKLLPDLSMAFNSMTMKGTGADNVFYNRSSRFNSVQFSIGVPIFHRAHTARIQSSKIAEQISENQLNMRMLEVQQALKEEYNRYQNQLSIIQYFEKSELVNAEKMTSAAQQQFNAGEINYMEWVLLMNNATSIRNQYADAVYRLNQSKIQLQYLMHK